MVQYVQMVKTSATSPNELASTAKPVAGHPEKSANSMHSDAARSAFTGAAIGMSWQLALIVLLPILGGYKLDQANHTTPLWTLFGLGIGLAGSIIVIRNALAKMNNFEVTKHDK
jgi:F0F1-type ATP synthase assembly protein I